MSEYLILATDRTATYNAEVRVVRSDQRFDDGRAKLTSEVNKGHRFESLEVARDFIRWTIEKTDENRVKPFWIFTPVEISPTDGLVREAVHESIRGENESQGEGDEARAREDERTGGAFLERMLGFVDGVRRDSAMGV